MTRVLIVEDEESYSEALSYVLRKEGFDVAVAATGDEALAEFGRSGADIVLLDLMLPGLPGTEVCRQMRQTSNVPIIMVSAKDTEVDKVVGLELGADDYVTKPYSPRELMARVRTLLRRSRTPVRDEERVLNAGPITVDPARHAVLVDGEPVECTPVEFQLLRALAARPGRVLSRAQLLELIHGISGYITERTIDVHVKNLRRKIEPNPRRPVRLVTVYGVGYKLVGPERGR